MKQVYVTNKEINSNENNTNNINLGRNQNFIL